MNGYNLFELAIMAFIVCGIAYVIWRGGAANPESTGQLGARVGRIDSRLRHVETEVEHIKKEGASSDDIAELREHLATIRAEAHGARNMGERTFASVDRIERFLIEKGLGR